jgi:hypothetical protein
MTLAHVLVFLAVVVAVLSMPGCASVGKLGELPAQAKTVNPSVLVKKAPGVPVGKLSQALAATPLPSEDPTHSVAAMLEWEALMEAKAEAKCEVHGGVVRWNFGMAECQNGAGIVIR